LKGREGATKIICNILSKKTRSLKQVASKKIETREEIGQILNLQDTRSQLTSIKQGKWRE
jgi:hypothetical protein